MRVVILSKALVVGVYQSKLAQLAALPDIELSAIVPPAWRDERGTLQLEQGSAGGCQMFVTSIAFNGNFHLHYYPQLNALLAQIKPDLLHIDEEPYNLASFLAVRAAQRIGARSVFFSWQNLNRRYPPPFNWFERYVLNHTQACIAGNHDAELVWCTKGFRGPIAVIPQFGVEPDVFQPGQPQRPSTEFRIGYVGRFVTEKGVDVLLRAVAKLEGNWRVELIGSGPAHDHLIELARQLHLVDRVSFLPWLPSEEIADHYRTLDALVLPSRSQTNWKEQFGRALVEAMACGVPVIGSTCGEIPNVIGDAGLIFPEGDAAALCAHLNRLQNNLDLRRELAQHGRQRVLAHFTQACVARQTYEVYQRVMGSGEMPGNKN